MSDAERRDDIAMEGPVGFRVQRQQPSGSGQLEMGEPSIGMGLEQQRRDEAAVRGSALASAAALRTLVGNAADGVRVSLELDVVSTHETVSLEVDDDGLPMLDDAAAWPLEAE